MKKYQQIIILKSKKCPHLVQMIMQKKLHVVEEVINILTNANNAVSKRISSEVASTKAKILAQ